MYQVHQALHAEKVSIHGELNPRNIFITEKDIFLINWEYTGFNDPFFDLSYVAIFHGYNEKEELLLLEHYLQHKPCPSELKRYYLTKQINLYDLCIFFHYFAIKLNPNNEKLDDMTPLKNWSDYTKHFLSIRLRHQPSSFLI